MSKTVAQASHHQPNAKKKKSAPTKYDEDRPLRGKVFFLDLPGYKHTDTIERKLVQRGATVDTFFHSGVKYLVTCRHKSSGKKGDAVPTTSQSSGKSLGAGGQLGVPSPSSDSSKSKSIPVAYGTRAAKMLAASLEKQGAKSNEADLLKVARRFGTRVISLEELLKELRKFKSLPVAKENKNTKDKKQYKVTKLKPVFMKIEDNSGAYRPLVFEAEAWPLPLVGCSVSACPYDLPRGSGRSRAAQPSRATGARLTQELPVSLRDLSAPIAGTTTTTVIKKRPGYCECCSVRYEDLKMHLRSKKHLDYANNPANFATLDALVEEGGYSYPQFLERLKQQQQQQQQQQHQQQQRQNCEMTEDTVVLLTPPSSPPITASTPAKLGSNVISISTNT